MDTQLTGFNGVRSDPLSGTSHLGNGYRAYNPVLMRFHHPDSLSPFGGAGLNAYSYCQNDPVNRIDPSGHLSWGAMVGIVGGIAGIILAPVTGGGSLAISTLMAVSSAFSGGLALASGLTENTAPDVSAILGWTSLIVGLPTAIAGAWGLGKAAASVGRQAMAFISKLERGQGGLIGLAMSGRGLGGQASLAQRTLSPVEWFNIERITYEMDAYDAARSQLNLPDRIGARPELGPHRQIVHISNPRLPAYSQELRAIFPVPDHLERQLQAYYTQLNIRQELRSFRVTAPPPPEDAAAAALQQRRLPPPPQRPLPPPPQRPLPPPPYLETDPHPRPAYPAAEPDYVSRRGAPPDYQP